LNNTDVEKPNHDCKPKLGINFKIVPQSGWLIGILFQNKKIK